MSASLPAELANDVMAIDEPLPTPEALAEIVADQLAGAGLHRKVPAEQAARAVEAVQGLSAFAAEQAVALSLRKSGIDIESLWERKRHQIEQQPALRIFRDGEPFSAIGGCAVVKSFLSRLLVGRRRPRAVIFIDEIEKAMAGATGGDLSGTSADQLGSLLSHMQDTGAAGCIFVGPPGAAKSAVAKAAGVTGGIPTIQLDLGAAKGSLVGQSEQQIRSALKVISAVSSDQTLWIATCNSLADLPPELRRRFTLGTYFFDLPDAEERAAIWKIYREKYGINPEDGIVSNDDGWTGAEIKQCCDVADRLGCSLADAAQFVVPIARSAADRIARLRDAAHGRLLSASRPGVYVKPDAATPATSAGGRRFDLAD